MPLRWESARKSKGKNTSGNKLVYVSGAPSRSTSEGCFEAAEQSNGLFLEWVMLGTELGFHETASRQDRRTGRGTHRREAGMTGLELKYEEDLTARRGPLFDCGVLGKDAWLMDSLYSGTKNGDRSVMRRFLTLQQEALQSTAQLLTLAPKIAPDLKTRLHQHRHNVARQPGPDGAGTALDHRCI